MTDKFQIDPDLTPVQNSPEKNLWAAVLLQAFVDLEVLTFGNLTKSSLARGQGEAWIKSNRNDYIGSFLYVCDVLDLDPEFVRAKFVKAQERVKRKEKVMHGVTARIKNFDPAKLENMTCLEIASYFNTTKSLVYNIVSDLGIEYKHIKRGSGNHRKKLLTT